jgi:hypothetical protein
MRRCFVCGQRIPPERDCYRDHDKRIVCVECAVKLGVKR